MGHIRGLDGIRALSVLAIIAFHTGLNSVPGGFYGVDSFFVLSGFLITSLLVREWSGSGTIRLRRFWAGRARRLLPALFLLVAVIGIVLAVVPSLLADAEHPRRRPLDDVLLLELVLHPQRRDVLLAVHASRRRCCTRGRWRSRSSSTWCGRSWCSPCSSSARRATPAPRRCPADRAAAARRRRAVDVLGGGQLLLVGPPPVHDDPAWTRRRRLQSSSPWPASARSPRPSSWPSWRPTATPPGPTTAPTPGPRRCSSARPSPSG